MPVRRLRALPVGLLIAAVCFTACTVSEQGKNSPSPQGGSAGGATASANAPAATPQGTAITPTAKSATADTATGAPPAPPAAPEATGGEADRTVAAIDVDKEFPAARALYVNRYAAQSSKRMKQLIKIADETEINALVIDLKDEFGLNYKPKDAEFRRNEGTAGTIRNLPALLDTLRAHKILPIARLVVFKDSVTARVHPEWTIRKPDGSVWRDKKKLPWVNPYHHELWDYNIGVAEELGRMGFSEIQFDYIRFPEPYASLPAQVFPGNKGTTKPAELAAFLKEANGRLNRIGVRTTADIFGLVTTVDGPLEVGQWWEKLSPVTDVLLPMVYPSHYPRGEFNIPYPNAEPYRTVKIAICKAHERDAKLGIKTPEHVRPYLQAFTLGKPHYGPEQLNAQKKATYDCGYDGWALWNAGSKYEEFLPALEKEFVSRKKR